LGWFPSGLPAAQPSEEPRLKSDPWASGVLLSELVSLLLVDDRSSVKEVEQFDDVGRLVGPPKLLLNGTHADVKSRAQVRRPPLVAAAPSPAARRRRLVVSSSHRPRRV
jgi:hypothetical protein